jgi:uncharacterized protein YlxW (UPF0749 family)
MSEHENPIPDYKEGQWKSELRWAEDEPSNEKFRIQVLEMTRHLEDNAQGLQNEIAEFGGEAALENAIKNDGSIAARWENMNTKLKYVLKGIAAAAGVAGTGVAIGLANEGLHRLSEEQGLVTVGTVLSLIALIHIARKGFEALEGETLTGKKLEPKGSN